MIGCVRRRRDANNRVAGQVPKLNSRVVQFADDAQPKRYRRGWQIAEQFRFIVGNDDAIRLVRVTLNPGEIGGDGLSVGPLGMGAFLPGSCNLDRGRWVVGDQLVQAG